ncbi:hypothetical protein C8R45DRAFT_995885 [Mycena sanguinolenta]|nr:hypothetical protein C8R45DRAFT_995885 [Mycena sanguinolenta]
MNEDERVRAAISMTLCELATATHHTIPLECASFTVDSESSPTQTQGECVDALFRSSQFWSSYTGYFREVPQLCFAFRRWNDIDTAKDIYKDSIMEMTAIARAILARDQVDVEGKKRWDSQISGLQEVAIRLKTVSDLIDNMMTVRLQNELTSIVDAFRAELANVQINSTIENTRIINQISSELQLASQTHAHALNDLVPFFQRSLVNDLNATLSPFRTQSQNALDLALLAHEGWLNLTVQFNAMQQTTLELSNSVSDTAVILAASSKEAHDSQISASLSASQLAETLAQLTITTQDSIEKLNASAAQLAHSLSPRSGLLDLFRLMEAAFPMSTAYLHHLPIFPVLSVILYLLRSSFSALISIALLFFSSRKYIIRPRHDHPAVSHVVTPSVPSNFTRHRDPEIISRPQIRISRIPDRLCKH